MKIALEQLAVAAAATALLFAVASANGADAVPLGKIGGLYFEAARGVFVEQSASPAPQGAARWAEVELGARDGQPRRRVMVQLPQALEAEKGDLVEVRLAPAASAHKIMLAPLAERSRATLVAAKWFTPQARSFDGKNAVQVSELLR